MEEHKTDEVKLEVDEDTGGGDGSPGPTRVVHASSREKNRAHGYPVNTVKNTKYTWWNFIPKNLAEQFSLHINRYFLLIACLQLIAVLTPVNPITTWGPLIVIFAITAVKEGIDDLGRYEEDKKANERLYWVIQNGEKVRVPSGEIEVGDILYIEEDEEFPCDMLLLGSSKKNGSVFVQTANLDGETNFKQRQVLPETLELPLESVRNFSGVVECAEPNAEVYKFDSRLWLAPSIDMETPDSPPIAVTGEQLLQQTTRLVNTEYVYGLVVYTGNETKFGKNRGGTPYKYTKVDKFINKIAVIIFCFQLTLVIILGAIGDSFRTGASAKHWYLEWDLTSTEWYTPLIVPGRFLLLNSTMIPISLKVTLDLCKLIYSKFINSDLGMYHAETDEPAYAKNTSISEDLGQIEYVLTDKTGTLTQNSMIFKQASVGDQIYDANACEPGQLLEKRVASRSEQELEMMRNFALNNAVVPVKHEDGSYSYKGSSPDEVALVIAAARYGVELVSREGKNVHVNVLGKMEKYVMLEELKFTSDRRRMSVVILNVETNKIRLYVKGADDVIAARVDPSQVQAARRSLIHVETFAASGLRTLFFAYRDVDPKDFAAWQDDFRKANTAVSNRTHKLELVYEKLEKGFLVQGCTAIEDKLQVGVSSTIAQLRRAGIKVWMLTGDKFSTALQIATACSLRSRDTDASVLCPLEGTEKEVIFMTLKRHLRATDGTEKEVTVIVRGSTLEVALLYYKEQFTKLCMRANSVICCRVTPAQKADLVHLVRNEGAMTLAIGDGGNDVAMIQQAHVGVGIRGKEGLQAARAADYTISFFGALERLVLIHGRYSYLRTSLVAQYSYYKSLMFCFVQIQFAFVSFFSGASLFNSLCITIYNAALFVPIVTFTLDKDVSFETILRNPELYRECQRSEPFNYKTFAVWAVRGFLQAILLFVFTWATRGPEFHMANNGYPSDWETLGIVAFGAYLWVQGFTMTLELQNLTVVSVIAIWGMHILTFLILIFTNALLVFDTLNGYWIVFVALAEPQLWFHNLLVTAVCVLPVVAAKYYQFNYYPKAVDHLRFLAARSDDKQQHITRASSGTSLPLLGAQLAVRSPSSPSARRARKSRAH